MYYKKIGYHYIIYFLFFLLSQNIVNSQTLPIQFNGYGHVEYIVDRSSGKTNSYFSLGEHDFFVRANINKRISFLGEFVLRFNSNSPTTFLPSIERSLVRFALDSKNAIIGGKVHTPVNYWNDSYHHGRVFFPVIERPFAFSYFVPLHTLGIQAQGQNLGPLNFGYDLMVGNGINSTDFSSKTFIPAVMASFHFKPVEGARIEMGYYFNRMAENGYSTHSGHSLTPLLTMDKVYKGALDYHLLTGSVAYFGNHIEILNELCYNASQTDTLGLANNISNFTYLGIRIKEKHIPYILVDYIKTAANDLHVYPMEMIKMSVGYRYEFDYLVNLKVQFEYQVRNTSGFISDFKDGIFGGRIQLAYGF